MMSHIHRFVLFSLVLLLCHMSQFACAESRASLDGPRVEKIAFHSSRSGSLQIYIMNTDGSGIQRLTNNSAADVGPLISPDGCTITFTSNRDGSDYIYLMDIDGGNQRRLTNTAGAEIEPAWSPDGKKIYYRKEMGDKKTAICVINTDGKGFRQLTDGSVRLMTPSVSPDGKTILYVNGTEIWIMNVDGSNHRRIAKTAGLMASYPRWSIDGGKIIYGLVMGIPPNHKTEIFAMNADGSGEVALTHAESISEYPCWSPNGRFIAFQSCRDGNFEIYVMNADGNDPRRLTDHPAMDGRPSWGNCLARAGSQF